MKKKDKKPEKAREFEKDLSYNAIGKLLTMPIPLFTPKAHIPIWGIVMAILWIASLFVWPLVFGQAPVIWFHVIFLGLMVISVLTTGASGQNLLVWLGLKPPLLRKAEVPPDNKPISLPLVRAVIYSSLGVEMAIWLWWQVFNTRPVYYPEEIVDPFELELIEEMHYAYEFSLYAWLLPILILVSILAVLALERLPILNFLLRRTRIMIVLVPVAAVWMIWVILRWLYETDIFTLF